MSVCMCRASGADQHGTILKTKPGEKLTRTDTHTHPGCGGPEEAGAAFDGAANFDTPNLYTKHTPSSTSSS